MKLKLRGVNVYVGSLAPFEKELENFANRYGDVKKRKRAGEVRSYVEYVSTDTNMIIRFTKANDEGMIGKAQVLAMEVESNDLKVYDYDEAMFKNECNSSVVYLNITSIISLLCRKAVQQWRADEFVKKTFSLN